jgi:hypothetical protein
MLARGTGFSPAADDRSGVRTGMTGQGQGRDETGVSGTARATFEITRWEAVPDGPTGAVEGVAGVRVEKTFTGDLTGTSVARLLACSEEGREGAGYIAMERVTGTLAGRTGTVVVQHGGLVGDGPTPSQFGDIVPGSATGELAGLLGTWRFQHDEAGAVVTIDWRFPPG